MIAIALLFLFSIHNETNEPSEPFRPVVGSTSVLAPKFDLTLMRFTGPPASQARYLLRYVHFKGHIGDTLKMLPAFLDSIMMDLLPVVSRDELRNYISRKGIDSMDIGGNISRPLSQTRSGITAGYFIIHDASNLMNPPYKHFTSVVNSPKWYHNQIWRQKNFRWAHAFINRFGESITSNDFEKPVYGTKFEKSDNNPGIGDTCVGNFIHIENIQPRRSSRRRRPYNDIIAISPGFTDRQYERLALLYLTASARKEGWLIPSFHAVIDEGIKDAHGDPQNFELIKWTNAIKKIYRHIKESKIQ
jgi:hypothetical protein